MNQTNIEQDTFEVILQVVKPDTGDRETLVNLSASVVGWEECAHEENFLLSDDGLDVDKADSSDGDDDDEDQAEVEIEDEDDDTADEEDDEDEEPKLDLQLILSLSVEAVKEYIAYRDSDDVFEDLLVTIVYKGMDGLPVFAHQYRCDPNLDLLHTSSAQTATGNAASHFSLECYESAKFNTVAEGHVYL